MKTLSELIAARGIDEAKAARRLKRNAYYDMHKDRTKVFASTPLGSIPRRVDNRLTDIHTINADLLTLKLADAMDIAQMPNRTRDYVAAWCRLNHLKGE
jgi:hypothetical protein